MFNIFYSLCFISAQIQTTNIMPFAAVLISLIGLVYTVRSFKLKLNEYEETQKEKMASKLYVKEKNAELDISILNVKEDLKEHKTQNLRDFDEQKHYNEREHNQIRKEVNDKLDLLIELYKNGQKS